MRCEVESGYGEECCQTHGRQWGLWETYESCVCSNRRVAPTKVWTQRPTEMRAAALMISQATLEPSLLDRLEQSTSRGDL